MWDDHTLWVASLSEPQDRGLDEDGERQLALGVR